ncbi:MAG: hypothetical protein AB7I18_05300 [Candidatus Berkiella sp.]
MKPGPETDNIQKLQQDIVNTFSTIKKSSYEAGTCKRVFRLPNNIALAVTHGSAGMEKDLIFNEQIYLNYLKEQGYPVVSMRGQVFAVEEEGKAIRYGYLMDYIPDAVFIETKSPALLKAQIYAALLGIPTHPSEGWWGINHSRIFNVISTMLQDPETFKEVQISAATLVQNYKNLIAKLRKDSLAISDLQMMLSKDGTLTIIDPLDVVRVDPKNNQLISIADPTRPPDAGFRDFLLRTNDWLNEGFKIAHTITSAANPEHLQTLAGTAKPEATTFKPLMNRHIRQVQASTARSGQDKAEPRTLPSRKKPQQ